MSLDGISECSSLDIDVDAARPTVLPRVCEVRFDNLSVEIRVKIAINRKQCRRRNLTGVAAQQTILFYTVLVRRGEQADRSLHCKLSPTYLPSSQQLLNWQAVTETQPGLHRGLEHCKDSLSARLFKRLLQSKHAATGLVPQIVLLYGASCLNSSLLSTLVISLLQSAYGW